MAGSAIQSYRDLGVWQKAIELSVLCYELTSKFPRDEMYGMTTQIRRSAVSVAANIVPKELIAMVAAATQGDFKTASKLHHKLFPLCRDMLSLATNPIPLKGAMKLLGRDTGELRLPMTELEEFEIVKLRKTLTTYGLL